MLSMPLSPSLVLFLLLSLSLSLSLAAINMTIYVNLDIWQANI